jgi:hypothetical protein
MQSAILGGAERTSLSRGVFPPPGVPDRNQLRRGSLHTAKVSAEKAVKPCEAAKACTHKSRLVGSGWSLSALPPKADICQRIEHVYSVPPADIGV